MQTGIRLVKILTYILSKFSCYSYNERVTFYFIYRYFLFNSGTNDAKAHLPKKPRLCDVCIYSRSEVANRIRIQPLVCRLLSTSLRKHQRFKTFLIHL